MPDYFRFRFYVDFILCAGLLFLGCASAFAARREDLRRELAIALRVAREEQKIRQPRDLLNLWQFTASVNRFLYRIESFEVWGKNKVRLYGWTEPKAEISKAWKIGAKSKAIEASYRFTFDLQTGVLLLSSAGFEFRFG